MRCQPPDGPPGDVSSPPGVSPSAAVPAPAPAVAAAVPAGPLSAARVDLGRAFAAVVAFVTLRDPHVRVRSSMRMPVQVVSSRSVV